MRLKSYFVQTMEEALRAAKMELGDDAMLVDTKPLQTGPGTRVRMEVIFASPTVTPPPTVPQAPTALNPNRGLQQFRCELAGLLDALGRKPDTARLGSASAAGSQLDWIRGKLLLAEVPPGTADAIVGICRPIVESLILRGEPSWADIERSVVPLLAAEWKHELPVATRFSRTIAVVGPTGGGKSSMIAKLAFHLGVARGAPVYVYSIDNLRVGASDQLAHLCSLLGVPFQSFDHSKALIAAIRGQAKRGQVLIDTPGYGSRDADILEETARDLAELEQVACHLVLPASLRYRELVRRKESYAAFPMTHLLFTRLDETEYFGPAWSFARYCGLPVEWVSTGPGVPEDIEEADASRMASALLGRAEYTPPQPPLPTASNFASAATAGNSRV